MRTFDLFNTLTTSRTGYNAGEALVEDHIPIFENIARVKPEDVIVSDYYNRDKARHILQDVCGLTNALICTEDGKSTGKVWVGLNSLGHLGDNPHTDFNSPRAAGIPAELTYLWQLTEREKQFGALGWVMREARLTTWHSDPAIRGLQLHQIEMNFPFLYRAAFEINQRMIAGGFERLLLCSRDCYLLYNLMFRVYPEAKYEIDYFYTSRLTRYRPTESYATYAKQALSGKTLVVDLNGSGNSLRYMTDMFGGTPLLVCGFGTTVPFLVAGGIRETSNPANHPMVSDVDEDCQPVHINPANVDWTKPQIMESIWALLGAVNVLEHHNHIAPAYTLDLALRGMVNDPALEPLWQDHLADSTAAYELLNSGALPHAVIL